LWARCKSSLETLVRIMKDENSPPGAQALAANSLLDRAYGRPAQTIDANLNRKSVDQMSDAELMAIAAGAEEEPPAQKH
jgi:hypothetical protein